MFWLGGPKYMCNLSPQAGIKRVVPEVKGEVLTLAHQGSPQGIFKVGPGKCKRLYMPTSNESRDTRQKVHDLRECVLRFISELPQE